MPHGKWRKSRSCKKYQAWLVNDECRLYIVVIKFTWWVLKKWKAQNTRESWPGLGRKKLTYMWWHLHVYHHSNVFQNYTKIFLMVRVIIWRYNIVITLYWHKFYFYQVSYNMFLDVIWVRNNTISKTLYIHLIILTNRTIVTLKDTLIM